MTGIQWTDALEERFRENYETPEDPARGQSRCWPWTAGRFTSGYGQFRMGRVKVRAHRAMWSMIYGEIPEGFLVCHHCDNPLCVRPSHLFLGTSEDNARERDEKGRGLRGRKRPEAGSPGERNPAAILTETEVRSIRRRRSKGATYAELAERHGVALSTIAAIVQRKTWRNVV